MQVFMSLYIYKYLFNRFSCHKNCFCQFFNAKLTSTDIHLTHDMAIVHEFSVSVLDMLHSSFSKMEPHNRSYVKACQVRFTGKFNKGKKNLSLKNKGKKCINCHYGVIQLIAND